MSSGVPSHIPSHDAIGDLVNTYRTSHDDATRVNKDKEEEESSTNEDEETKEEEDEDDEEGPKCGYVEWVDPEWPPQLKTTLGRLWDMYEDENKLRLSDNLANAEGNFKVLKEKEKMEKDLRFFKLDFAKMVADKEQALAELGNTKIALTDRKKELQKKSISDKSATNIYQVFWAKAEKDLELMKKELKLMKQEREKTMKDSDEVMQEMEKVMQGRDALKKDKNKLEYMTGDLFNHKEETKSKIRKVREILDGFE
ncbi:putative CBL-interacting protein kinase 13 [Hordeum vulgare]|nr:putative CBL-interacting protein kinase 13 [Hordeum vulgare]